MSHLTKALKAAFKILLLMALFCQTAEALTARSTAHRNQRTERFQ